MLKNYENLNSHSWDIPHVISDLLIWLAPPDYSQLTQEYHLVALWCSGRTMVCCFSNPGSIPTLVHWQVAMVRLAEDDPLWKYSFQLFVGQLSHWNNSWSSNHLEVWRSICKQNSKYSTMLFLTCCKLIILGTLGMPEQNHLKLWHQFRALSEVYLHSKNLENPTKYSW